MALDMLVTELENQAMLSDQIAALTKANSDLATGLNTIATTPAGDNPDLAALIPQVQVNVTTAQNIAVRLATAAAPATPAPVTPAPAPAQ